MITRRMEDKLEELKSYFNTKFNKLEESQTKTFNNIVADLKKEITKEIQHEVSKQSKQLDFENKTKSWDSMVCIFAYALTVCLQ